MARSFLAHCFALAALGVCIPALHAQDHLLDDLYGRGVHAYFSRNYQDAHKHLSDAATSGSKDPRVYYFRALVDNRLNRPQDAVANLNTATELEFSGDDPVNVSKALERIQGTERLLIEDARRKARLAIRNAAEARAKIRYDNRIKAEAKVLRNPPAIGVAPATAEAPAAGGTDKTDPFDPTATEPLPTTPTRPKPSAVPDAEPAAPPPAKPAAADPFGEEPAKPAAPAEVKPAAPGTAPAKPAAEDPFGEPAKPAAPAEVEPAVPGAAAAKPAAVDPFGDAPARPATPAPAEVPVEVKPAAAADPAAPPSGKGTILGSFSRAFSKAVPLPTIPAVPGIPGVKPPVVAEPPAEVPIPKGDPNAPDPFGDAPAAKPAAPKAPGAPPAAAPPKPAAADPFADDAPAAAPARGAAPAKKPVEKAADEDPFK